MNVPTGEFRALRDRASAVDAISADVAGLAAEVAGLASALATMAEAATETQTMTDIMLGARRAGYARALADCDGREAAARARQARAAFRVIPGGKSRSAS